MQFRKSWASSTKKTMNERRRPQKGQNGQSNSRRSSILARSFQTIYPYRDSARILANRDLRKVEQQVHLSHPKRTAERLHGRQRHKKAVCGNRRQPAAGECSRKDITMIPRKEAQRKGILKYLQERGKITPLEALNEFGCLRLSARIYELRQIGWDIETVKPDSGKKRYAVYLLKGEDDG